MGRDDAKPVGGLQGGTAPARAFHDFMSVAVANRPVEQFETQVPMPDWQLSPEEEMYGDQPVDENGVQPMVDENGMPINAPQQQQQPGYPQQQPMVRPDGTGDPTQQELDQAFPPQQRSTSPRQQPYPRQPQPQPDSAPPPETPQPRPETA
jgi:penicillin-binding protein 1A